MSKINIFNEIEILESVFEGKIVDTFEGNSGKVYLVKNVPVPPKTQVFPKYIAYKKCKRYDGDSFDIFKEEINKWFQIVSRYVLPIQYIDIIDDQYYVCMRSGLHGTLANLLLEGMDEITSFNISLQIVKGLIDMSNSGIKYHQDLNPPNIMYEDMSYFFDDQGRPILFRENYKPFPPEHNHISFKYRIMISDFGMANYFLKDSIKGKAGGKFAYKAPEQYDPSIDGFEPDLFALGVILCLIFTGKHPTGKTIKFALNKSPKLKQGWERWAKEGARIVECKNENIRKLINALLNPSPKSRPSLNFCLEVLLREFKEFDNHQASLCVFYFDEFEKIYRESKKNKLETRMHAI